VGITAIVLETQKILCPESMSLAFGNSWLQIIKAVSVTLATFYLIEFYILIRKDIAYIPN
jgi:Organic solute transporter Ostalpha